MPKSLKPIWNKRPTNTVKAPWVEPDNKEHTKTDPFYSSVRWQKLREIERKTHVFCAYCNTAHTELIDHVLPRRLFPELKMDRSNLVGCCNPCHGKKGKTEWKIKTKEEARHKLRWWVDKAREEHDRIKRMYNEIK